MAVGKILSAFGKLGILALVAVAFAFGLVVTVYLSLRSPNIQVPDVVNQSYLDGEKALAKAGLDIRERAKRYKPDVPPGMILDQSPRAGDVVKAGQTIAVIVSRAPKEGERPPDEEIIEERREERGTEALDENRNQNSNRRRNTNRNANSNSNANGATNANANGGSGQNSNAGNTNSGDANVTANRNTAANRNANSSAPRNRNANTAAGNRNAGARGTSPGRPANSNRRPNL